MAMYCITDNGCIHEYKHIKVNNDETAAVIYAVHRLYPQLSNENV